MAEDQHQTPSFFIDKLLQKPAQKMTETPMGEIYCSAGETSEGQTEPQVRGEARNVEVIGHMEINQPTSASTITEFRGIPPQGTLGNAPVNINQHIGYQSSGICYSKAQEDMPGGGGGNMHVEVTSTDGKFSCFGIGGCDTEDREIIEGQIQGRIQSQEHSTITIQGDNKPEVDMNVGDDGKKRPRTAFSAEQVRSLEQEFQRSKYLSVSKRTEMSRQLGLTEQQIKIWFQNRRTKWKRKYTNNLEILAQQHYLRMGLLPAYPLPTPGGSTKPPNQYGGLFGPNLTVRPAFGSPHQTTVRLYPPFSGPGLPRM